MRLIIIANWLIAMVKAFFMIHVAIKNFPVTFATFIKNIPPLKYMIQSCTMDPHLYGHLRSAVDCLDN